METEGATGSVSQGNGTTSRLCLRGMILGQLSYCAQEGALPPRGGGEKLRKTQEGLFKIVTFFSGCISLTGVQHIFKL